MTDPRKPHRILIVYGTRPEAIKLAPVIHTLQASDRFNVIVCESGQHRELLQQAADAFGLVADCTLDVMTERQTLFQVTSRVLEGMESVIKETRPDMVVVQGDTTTTFASALAAMYLKVPVAHVEAGLRTFDLNNPFPEEMNRRLTSQIASLHFAPTSVAQEHLIREGVDPKSIYLTGNTIVDAVQWICRNRAEDFAKLSDRLPVQWNRNIPILVTAHRRENWGAGMDGICEGLRRLVEADNSLEVIFSVHPNPVVSEAIHSRLGNSPRIHLVSALSYPDFVAVLSRCKLVITDSGGVQEEAASLNKPVVITREKTERPELVTCGLGRLAGTDPTRIVEAAREFLGKDVNCLESPFGDGTASRQIALHIKEFLSARNC